MSVKDRGVTAFRCDVVPERDHVRLVPIGEIDLATVPVIDEEARTLVAAGFTLVVLDLRETTFMDSTGLHLVLRLDAEARSDGHRFLVISGPPQVQRLFEITDTAAQLPFVSPADLLGDSSNGGRSAS